MQDLGAGAAPAAKDIFDYHLSIIEGRSFGPAATAGPTLHPRASTMLRSGGMPSACAQHQPSRWQSLVHELSAGHTIPRPFQSWHPDTEPCSQAHQNNTEAERRDEDSHRHLHCHLGRSSAGQERTHTLAKAFSELLTVGCALRRTRRSLRQREATRTLRAPSPWPRRLWTKAASWYALGHALARAGGMRLRASPCAVGIAGLRGMVQCSTCNDACACLCHGLWGVKGRSGGRLCPCVAGLRLLCTCSCGGEGGRGEAV